MPTPVFALHGIAASELRARQLVEQAIETIATLDLQSRVLEELAEFVIARNS
jgi:hypothetical protein